MPMLTNNKQSKAATDFRCQVFLCEFASFPYLILPFNLTTSAQKGRYQLRDSISPKSISSGKILNICLQSDPVAV